MAIKGSLKEASLADVCQLLALGLKTGCLSITDRSRFGQIFFDRGRITFSRIVNRRDRLGDLLVREGVITQDQLNTAVAQQSANSEKKLGEVLVDQRLISKDDLTRFVKLQIEEAIYHLFTWTRGSFFFEADQAPDADITVSINPDSLLLEAARRVDEWSLIEKKIPSLDLIFEVDRERVKEAFSELTPEQQRILTLLDGAHTVTDVAEETGMTEFDVGKALFGLIQANFAHRVGKREVSVVRGKESEINERRNLGLAFYHTGMMEEARAEYARVLELASTDVQSRFYLALISLREEQPRDAVRQLKSLLEDTGPRFGAFINLAYALRALNRPADALLVLGEAESLRPRSPIVALMRGVALVEARDLESAAASLQEYRDRLPSGRTPADTYFYYAALTAALRKRLNEADQLIQKGVELHPGNAPLLLLAGLIAERKGEFVGAEKWFRRVLEEDPTLVQAHKNLGDVAYRRGAHDEAFEHLSRAVQLKSDLGDDSYAKLGNIYYKKRDIEAALRNWSRALELNPGNQIVRNNIEIVQDAGI
jgi:tetratricopeptide (TPR) repeat protein